jgi:hypothetical protein
MQDPQGSVTVVDVKTMKAIAHYPFGDLGGGCNGLAFDAKNKVLFAACARSGNPPDAKPQMVILSATDGKILKTLPLAGCIGWRDVQPVDDGGLQHAGQRHTHHRQGDEPDDVRGRAEPADDELRADDRVRQARRGTSSRWRTSAGRRRRRRPADALGGALRFRGRSLFS